MGELGNFFTVCVIFGNIVRFAGTLTAQTRQDSETTPTGRTPHPPSFARPRSQQTAFELRSSLVCTTRGVHFVDFWPHTGPFASIPVPHEPKTYRFLPHFVAVNSQGEGYGWGCGIVYGGCIVGVGCGS